MADVVEKVAETVTAPGGWAKAKPLAFVLFLLVVVLVAIRFRETIAAWIAKIPFGVGKFLTGIAHAGAAAFIVAALVGGAS